MANDIQQQIAEIIKDNRVVLFMKGTRIFPQCGFSARAVDIFKQCGVSIKDVNVLADPELRQGIKDFSNWPTIPQAYIDGEFVGGSDIILEMFENGELQGLLGVEAQSPSADTKPPQLVVSDGARAAFQEALPKEGDEVLRFESSPTFQYDLYVGPKQGNDFEVDAGGGLKIYVPRASAEHLDGTHLDWAEGPDGDKGFKIDNPNEPR